MKPHLLLIGDVNKRMYERLQSEFIVHRLPQGDDLAGFLTQTGPLVTAVATNGGVGLARDVMESLPALKIVSSYGVGYDAIDVDRAAERGIVVTHTPNVLNDDVANTAILLWMAVERKLVVHDAHVRAGRWETDGNLPLTRSPQNRRVGIVGLGRIGQAIADRLQVFGASIAYTARGPKDVPYDYYAEVCELADDCDVLICITPGGPGTKHLINADVIKALGPEGVLINVARGSVVDEPALIAALEKGDLGGAGLDVFEDEPRVPAALRSLGNVVLLPHVGSATFETRRAMGDLTCDNLSQFLKNGTTLTPVPECANL